MKKGLLSVFAVAFLPSACLAAYFYNQMLSERERAEIHSAKVAVLEADIEALRVRTSGSAVFAAHKSDGVTEDLRDPSPQINESNGSPGRNAGDVTAAKQLLEKEEARNKAVQWQAYIESMKDSKVYAKRREEVMERLKAKNPDLATELGLSEEVANQVFEILAEQRLKASIIAGSDNREALFAAEENLRIETEAMLAGMLGSKFPLYQKYQRTLPQREMVQVMGLFVSLESGGAMRPELSFRPEQRQRILGVLVDQKISMEVLQSDPDRILSRIKPVLTSEQYQVLAKNLQLMKNHEN